MTPAENAFNCLYPPALRLSALKRRFDNAARMGHDEEMDSVGDEIIAAVNAISEAVETIEAGQFENQLSTSLAGVLNQMKLRASHN